MKIIFDPEEPLKFSTSATIGIFDGVHIGHKKILSLVQKKARQKGICSCVITFNPHPQKVLRKTDIALIIPLRERFRLLKEEGVDITVCYTFTEEFASISAKDFIRHILIRKLNVKNLFVGPDFFFGKSREGNVELLHTMGRMYKFETEVVEPAYLNGEVVSSTIIRRFIEDGMVRRAARFLGKSFSIEGTVKEGEKRGRGDRGGRGHLKSGVKRRGGASWETGGKEFNSKDNVSLVACHCLAVEFPVSCFPMRVSISK